MNRERIWVTGLWQYKPSDQQELPSITRWRGLLIYLWLQVVGDYTDSDGCRWSLF